MAYPYTNIRCLKCKELFGNSDFALEHVQKTSHTKFEIAYFNMELY